MSNRSDRVGPATSGILGGTGDEITVSQLPGSKAEPADLLTHFLGWDRWTTEHGLAGNKIRALLQSRDGYLWIGTEKGVTRFDGVQFKALTSENTPG